MAEALGRFAGRPTHLLDLDDAASDIRQALALLLRQWCAAAPTADALVLETGVICRQELADSALDLQRQLQALLGRRRCSVAVHLGNHPLNLALGLALFGSGHCQLVLPTHAAAAEWARLLAATPCQLLISDQEGFPLADQPALLLGRLAAEPALNVWGLKPGEWAGDNSGDAGRVRLTDAAFITHSSGTTTGLPAPNVSPFLLPLSYALSGPDWVYFTPRRLVEASFQFSAPRKQLLTHLLAGAALCLYSRQDQARLGSLYGDMAATRLHLFVPGLRRHLCGTGPRSFPAGARFLTGTDRVPQALRQQVVACYPGSLAIVYSTSQLGAITLLPEERLLEVEESVGWTLGDVAISPVQAGVDLHQAFEVAVDKQWPIPYRTPDGRECVHVHRRQGCRTGDMLRLDPGGQMVFCGRADDVFLFRGVLIYPLELEAALEASNAVEEAVVFGALSERYGAVPMAVVTLREGVDPEQTCRALMRQSKQLFGFRGLYAVHAEAEIPRGIGQKPLRRLLAERYRLP